MVFYSHKCNYFLVLATIASTAACVLYRPNLLHVFPSPDSFSWSPHRSRGLPKLVPSIRFKPSGLLVCTVSTPTTKTFCSSLELLCQDTGITNYLSSRSVLFSIFFNWSKKNSYLNSSLYIDYRQSLNSATLSNMRIMSKWRKQASTMFSSAVGKGCPLPIGMY